jgi:hypothetical protein
MIAERFKAIMDYYGLSAAEMARAVGETRPEKVLNIIHGKNKPNYSTLELFIQAYPDINANYLFGTEDNMLRSVKYDKAGIRQAIGILEDFLKPPVSPEGAI